MEEQEYSLIDVIIAYAITIFGSWLFTVLVVWGITMCFNMVFTLKFATGIWLMLSLIREFFDLDKEDEPRYQIVYGNQQDEDKGAE